MPPWGRPPGGSVGAHRRHWDRQPPREWDDQYRFEELHSEDEGGRGIFLDSALQKGEYAYNEDLQFPGAELDRRWRNSRNSSYDDLAYGDTYGVSGEEDYEDLAGYASVAARDADELLAQKAFDRIRRAREQGRTNVNLAREEMDALERRRLAQQPPELGVVKTSKSKSGGSSSAAGSVRSKKKRSLSRSQAGSPVVVRSRGPSKPTKRGSGSATDDAGPAYPANPPAPGFLGYAAGAPPIYAPIAYYPAPPPAPAAQSSSRPGSRHSSRSGSVSSRQRPSTPPHGQNPPPPQHYSHPRYFSAPIDPQHPPPGYRPSTSSSARGSPTLNNDDDWPARARPRARASTGVSGPYPLDAYAYAYPAPPPHSSPTSNPHPHPQPRRHASGPAESSSSSGAAYGTLRRVPPTVGLGASGARAYHGGPGWASDPTLRRESSGLGNEITASPDEDSGGSSGESVDEDAGAGSEAVLVDIGPDGWPVGVAARSARGSGGSAGLVGGSGSASGGGSVRHRKGRR